MSEPVASIVVGFKDWGLDRLARCIGSVLTSFGDLQAEVIVSDYGSTDGDSVASIATSAGARYVRTETDGTWSRSRSLNAGFAVAMGEQFFATDADMIFTPGALASVSQRLSAFPNEAVILQCRDLPPDVGTEDADEIDWADCERVATIRPRWGMGGLVATRRDLFSRLQGYDERMHTYGGEDIDYAKRLRRLGAPINWLDTPGIRMYHVWHPSSRLAASLDESSEAAIAHNRRIHSEDSTTVRNRVLPRHVAGHAHPIVSVVMAADHGPATLNEELSNILGQTVTNLEVLVVDTHGHAAHVAEELNDERLRVVTVPGDGWWRALGEARGTYSILHAPRSWYPPNRLEVLLDRTTDRQVMPSDLALTAIMSERDELLALPVSAGSPQKRPWASLLLPTNIVQALLDPLGSEATDPNDLVYALLRNGLTVETVADIARVDVVESTPEGEIHQEDLARSAQRLWRRLAAAEISGAWLMEAPAASTTQKLLKTTQQLMRDRVDLVVCSSDEEVLERVISAIGAHAAIDQSWVTDNTGQRLFGVLQTAGVPGTRARLAMRAVAPSVARGDTRFDILTDDASLPLGPPVTRLLHEYSRLYAAEPHSAIWVVVQADLESAASAVSAMNRVAGITVALHRVLQTKGTDPAHIALGLVSDRRAALASLLAIRPDMPDDASVDLWFGQAHHGVTLADLAEDAS